MKSLSVKVKGTLQRTLFVPFNSLLLFIIILFYLDYSNSQLQYFMQKKGSALFLQFTELSNTQSLVIYRVFNSEFYIYPIVRKILPVLFYVISGIELKL